MDYTPREIEKKWNQWWKEKGIYHVSHENDRPKYYVLDMFPYPSGAGLHVGHPMGYIASDIYARFKRLEGFNVLHPMGFDAFGLPAEQYAIQTGVHPAKSTEQNIKRYRQQLENLGFCYDWNREIRTCDPDYYKWTQWIFLKLYDHYYDLEQDKARPVSDLIARFENSGNEEVQASSSQKSKFDAEEWHGMTAKEKDDVLMNYRLAYRKVSYVNWCEALGTVLANDEVKDGVSERGGHPVERKAMLQWSLRITAYAERLLNGLESVDFTESLKTMQRNWIGRSEGARMHFPVVDSDHSIEIFTTRPDTIYGSTFMVLAPEHPLVDKLTTPEQQPDVNKYKTYVASRSEIDRKSEIKEVSGAFTGAYARNPVSGERVPIWIAEYVLMDYGTGAIMAVPGDDERDYAFAKKFGLTIVEVIDRSDYPDTGRGDKVGVLKNSDLLNGLKIPDAIDKIMKYLEKEDIGRREVNYKLRDANFSRQRYWGEPFPIIYDEKGVSHPMNPQDLPLKLPDLDDYKPASGGRSPLARKDDWVNLDNGWTRETDTMPGYAGSSWYYLRYMDTENEKRFAGEDAVNYWRDVDLYMGGTEHAVGHLLYSRFWHKFLFDTGYVPTPEPYKRLINQGMIQGVIEYIYKVKDTDEQGVHYFLSAPLAKKRSVENLIRLPVHIDFVAQYGSEDSYLNAEGIRNFLNWRPEYKKAVFETEQGIIDFSDNSTTQTESGFRFYTESEIGKMSKSKFNVINPDDVVQEYGADCFRMYEMFLGPLDQDKPWDTNGIDGVYKFLKKAWGLFFDENDEWSVSEDQPDKQVRKVLHTAIKKVREDIERFSFNTCVSAFMVCVNDLRKLNCNNREILTEFVVLLAPFAPHIAEELWHRLGEKGTVHDASYPTFDPAVLVEDEIEYPICINGKKRSTHEFPADATKEELEAAAVELDDIQKWLEDKTVRKVIVVPKRMINIVAS